MKIAVAPLISQVRLDVPPAEMLLGVATKDIITGAVPSVALFTLIVADAVCVPKLLPADNV